MEYQSAEWWRDYREKNKLKLREYARKYNRKRYKTHAQQEQARRKRWEQANPDKVKAHSKVHYALKMGRLTKLPCQVCATTYSIIAHHDDYTKPLDVLWLCEVHHKERHSLLQKA